MRRPGLRLSFALAGLTLAACDAHPAGNGVIFMYHHVDSATPASTSVTPETFAEQLDWLEREDFTVLPLIELLDALAAGEEVPERSVALTFDDAYRSVLTTALPALSARGWPFTVFVNTEAIDSGYDGYLSWDELRTLGRRGAAIGNHSVSHTHLVRRLPGESERQWRARIAREIGDAESRLQAEVGDFLSPAFAYPYGEYTAGIKDLVAERGLYGLGQQSGAVGAASDFLALPRYPIATGLGLTADEFALRARSRALPAVPAEPERHVLGPDDDRPGLQLKLGTSDDIRVADLACYASGQGRMNVEWLDDAMTEFVARPTRPLGIGRSKYNCTAPSRSASGVYYWYGWLWMRRPTEDGWYDE